MYLREIKFCRNKGLPNEWQIEGRPHNGVFGQWLSFPEMTLIVGKNASGKSKTLDVIRNIADLFAGDNHLSRLHAAGEGTAEYQLRFDDNGSLIEYYLNFENGKILQETLTINAAEKLNRAAGKLWYEGVNKMLDFETDDDVLAISKRDKKQHSFFEALYAWGKHLSHYRFGTQLGKNALLRDMSAVRDDDEVDLKDSDQVASIFIKGRRLFSDAFTAAVLADMNAIAYDLKAIHVGPLKNFPVQGFGLHVQEGDLHDVTDQREMSQGMFRALSLLVQLNYSLLSKTPSCILIDDIGEGLDYDRSNSLIELIIGKVQGSAVQVIMTTNDRFVMNKVPLAYWSVIQRVGNKSIFFNHKNSQQTFDEFAYSGLSNFDFLKTEFYISGYEKEDD